MTIFKTKKRNNNCSISYNSLRHHNKKTVLQSMKARLAKELYEQIHLNDFRSTILHSELHNRKRVVKEKRIDLFCIKRVWPWSCLFAITLESGEHHRPRILRTLYVLKNDPIYNYIKLNDIHHASDFPPTTHTACMPLGNACKNALWLAH